MADDNNSSNIGWFLAGLGLGAVIGILYAPKSGRETRDAIISGAMEGRDYLATRAGEARESAAAWADRTKDSIRGQRDSIATAIEAGKSAYREATDKK